MAKPVSPAPGSILLLFVFCSAVFISPCLSAEQGDTNTDWSFAGHSKFQYIHTLIPENSVLQEISGDRLQDYNLEVRLKVAARRDRWDFNTHLQFITVRSDTLSASDDLPVLIFPGAGIINDDRRWFDLTHVFHNEGGNATLARLDRVSIGYTGDHTVVRFGRQAVSWGNGLLYTPMDIFNPFDPTTVDKEYKSGDDMLYGQYLLSDGSDLQAVAVVRRDLLSGDVEADQSSLAVKYHGFVGGYEYDMLLAEHYDDLVIGLGGSADIVGAVWRGDLVWTDTATDSVFSAVAGASYSWVAGKHNWTGVLEYFYNGFGQGNGNYSATDLARNPDLVKRLARGEVFNLGRHYLGVSATVEVTPLLLLSPNVFVNLTDPSAYAQLVMTYDWKQDLQVLAALNFPVGPNGSEYGGIESGQENLYLSTGPSLFAQLAWYF
jgi:hypothetical protein